MNGLIYHNGVSYCVLEVIANNAVEFEGSKNGEKGGWDFKVVWISLQCKTCEETYWGPTITKAMESAAEDMLRREDED